jgi:uncharacterized protein involved in exopolysaccharide biosynthesis
MNDNQFYRSSLYGALPQNGELRPWTPPTQDTVAAKAESGARRLWAVLGPERWFLVGCAAVCATVALIASFFQTPQYKAQTSLEIEALNDRFLQLNEVDPVTKGGNSDAYLQTQVDVLSSTALLSRVIKRLNMEEPYRKAAAYSEAHPSFLKVWKKGLGLNSQPLTPRELAMGEAKKYLDITAPRGSSRVVTLQFISTDPQLAANFPNTLAQEFIDHWH